jgi:hypothetical protein
VKRGRNIFPVEDTVVMRISREPFPVQTMIHQKQLANVEYFNYLRSVITNDARCTCEIKSRIAMAKAAFNRKKILHQQIGLKFNEEISAMLLLEHNVVWC